MDSSEEDNSGRCSPNELIDTAQAATRELALLASKERYDKMYKMFKAWYTSKGSTKISQTLVLAFFNELSQKHKPSTLWAYYSMLKCTIRANDSIDIGSYVQLTAFLRSKANGYLPVKSGVFSLADVHKFIDEAPDELWLDVKVVCIFAVSGACSSHELPKIKITDIENHGDTLLVRIVETKTKVVRSFTISGAFRAIVQKYADLRRPGMDDQRFFANYQRGKCTSQVIGKNKFCSMPRRIAQYLRLPNPNNFTGHSFRKTSHAFQKQSPSIFANAFVPVNPSVRFTAVEHNLMGNSRNSLQHTLPGSYPIAQNSDNSFNGSIAHCADTEADPHTATKGSKTKFGEIYCNDMGVLTYQCTLCPAEMDHSDEFSLHYMSHFRDVFQAKQEGQYIGPSILESDYIIPEPISTIKLEETVIKSEPMYFEDDG